MNLNKEQISLTGEPASFQQLIANAPVAMAMFDRDMRYIIHSDRWVTDYGLEGKSIIGKSHYEIFPDIPTRCRNNHQKGLNGIAQSRDEDEFVREDGSTLYLKWALQPWKNSEGEIGGIVLVTDNITELVLARKKAISANKAKSDFLATISHEIRTPMNGILGMADHLLDSDIEQKHRDIVKVIFKSTKTLLVIVNDVLDISAAEAGKLRFEEKVFKPAECMKSIFDLLSIQAAKKGLKINIVADPRMPPDLLGDEGRYRQIVLNLAGNAIKFTEKGSVTIRCDIKHNDTIRLSVMDTGPGLTRNQVKSVFDSFKKYYDKNGTTEGTGLGLAITKRLVEAMNGKVAMRSWKGRGTIVFVRFPLHIPTAEQINNSENQGHASGRYYSVSSKIDTTKEYDFKGMKIMLVEDNKVNQLVIKKILEPTGADLTIFSTGGEATSHCKMVQSDKDLPDAILMDLQLPDTDGYCVTREIRHLDRRWQKIPIIALTAAAFDEYRDRCLAAGMTDFLTKPIEKTILREKLAEYSSRLNSQ